LPTCVRSWARKPTKLDVHGDTVMPSRDHALRSNVSRSAGVARLRAYRRCGCHRGRSAW
jgi:hypothetical protein